MTLSSAEHALLVAIDANNEHRYEDGAKILSEVPVVVVRTRDAGVHFGRLAAISDDGSGTLRVLLHATQRIWSWEGALSLSEVSNNGISDGKLSVVAPTNMVMQVIEVLPCTDAALKTFTKHTPKK